MNVNQVSQEKNKKCRPLTPGPQKVDFATLGDDDKGLRRSDIDILNQTAEKSKFAVKSVSFTCIEPKRSKLAFNGQKELIYRLISEISDRHQVLNLN